MQNHLTSGVQIFHLYLTHQFFLFHFTFHLFIPLFFSFHSHHSFSSFSFSIALIFSHFFFTIFFFFMDDKWIIPNNITFLMHFSLSISPTLISLHSLLSSSYTNSTNPMIGLENFVFLLGSKVLWIRFTRKQVINIQFKLKGVH